MAVVKNSDGTYQSGSVSFATAEQAFAHDASRQGAEPSSNTSGPGTASPSDGTTQVGSRSRYPVRTGKPKSWVAGTMVVILAIGAGAAYFTPHWTLYRMRAAVEARDATAFSSHVDFPALKEDVKGQLMVRMSSVMQQPQMKDNPFAGFGQMLAVGVVNQLVDTFVSPAGVMMMLSEGKPTVDRNAPAAPPPLGPTKEQAPAYAIGYKDWSTVVLRSKDTSAAGAFVLKRQGLFSWKLAAVELPL
jgi:hypothetical protein